MRDHRTHVAPNWLWRPERIGRGDDGGDRPADVRIPLARALCPRGGSASGRLTIAPEVGQAALETRPVHDSGGRRRGGAVRRPLRGQRPQQPQRQRFCIHIGLQPRPGAGRAPARANRTLRSTRPRPRQARRGARRAAPIGPRRRARTRTGRPSAPGCAAIEPGLTSPRSRGSTMSSTAATACIARPDTQQGDVQVRPPAATPAPPRRP